MECSTSAVPTRAMACLASEISQDKFFLATWLRTLPQIGYITLHWIPSWGRLHCNNILQWAFLTGLWNLKQSWISLPDESQDWAHSGLSNCASTFDLIARLLSAEETDTWVCTSYSWQHSHLKRNAFLPLFIETDLRVTWYSIVKHKGNARRLWPAVYLSQGVWSEWLNPYHLYTSIVWMWLFDIKMRQIEGELRWWEGWNPWTSRVQTKVSTFKS